MQFAMVWCADGGALLYGRGRNRLMIHQWLEKGCAALSARSVIPTQKKEVLVLQSHDVDAFPTAKGNVKPHIFHDFQGERIETTVWERNGPGGCPDAFGQLFLQLIQIIL